MRSAHLEAGWREPNARGHEPGRCARSVIEDFTAIVAPHRTGPATVRYQKFFASRRKRANVNLIFPRFVGLVCQPFAIGRHSSMQFCKRRLKQGYGCTLAGRIGIGGQRPKILASSGAELVKYNVFPIRAPVRCELIVRSAREPFFSAAAGGLLAEELPHAAAVRVIDDVSAVG